MTSLDIRTKHLFLYLLTCEAINICGIFELPDSIIRADTGLTQPELDRSKGILHRSGKVFFKDGWIKVANVDRYNSYAGVLNEKAKERELSLVPSEVLNTSIDTSIEGVCIPTINQKSEIRNKKESRIVKGERPDLSNDELIEVSRRYNVPLSFVKVVYERMVNWHDENPARNRKINWLATLRNWVLKDSLQVKQNYAQANTKRAVDLSNLP